MKRIIFLLAFTSILYFPSQAQLVGGENNYLRKGNRAFSDGDYNASAEHYQKAIDANVQGHRGKFNLGDALYEQEQYTDAAQQFTTAAQLAKDKNAEFQAWHNLGNSLLQQAKTMPATGGQEGAPDKGQVLQSSIDAYKQALRLNPKDEDTRYNLAYAQKLKQQNEQQQQNSDQNNQNEDQENQDQQNQDQQNQDQQNQDQQNQDQQQQQQNQDQQQGDPQQSEQRNMTREEIERLLEALQYQEEKLQKELQKKKVKATKVKVEKDW